jgi:hypothetical protein
VEIEQEESKLRMPSRNKVDANAKSANAENNNTTCLFETNSPPMLDSARIKAMNDQIDEKELYQNAY